MAQQSGRYLSPAMVRAAKGWQAERLVPPSRLFGANGICTGPDGRIHVAQVSGSQISAIAPDSGAVETISPLGGDIVAPDDLVFDEWGNLYVTEITEGRVTMRRPNGRIEVLQGDVPVANPITYHRGALIAGECRIGGRIMEIDRQRGTPRIILDDVPMPNAFAVGPDDRLYFPVMAMNAIWRVDLAGGTAEVVAGELGVPTAVKFDPQGFILSTQAATGQVLRIDPQTGGRQELAQLAPGLDNLCFVGDRLFVSNMIGSITEIGPGGAVRDLIAGGLNWPLGLAACGDNLFVADGAFSHILSARSAQRTAGNLFSPGYPGYVRGVAHEGGGAFIVTTALGEVARFWPDVQKSEVLARGFDQLYGVAVGPGGDIVFAEQATGSVYCLQSSRTKCLAAGLAMPKGVAISRDGRCYVAESGVGRIVEITQRGTDTLIDGLDQPQGIVVVGATLHVVDAGSKQLLALDLETGSLTVIADNLPVGAPAGVVPKFLGPIGSMSGPMGSFAAVAAGAGGTLFVSADAEGSVIAFHNRTYGVSRSDCI